MEKYIGIFKNGKQIAVRAIDKNMAIFHLKDNERLNGKLCNVKKVA